MFLPDVTNIRSPTIFAPVVSPTSCWIDPRYSTFGDITASGGAADAGGARYSTESVASSRAARRDLILQDRNAERRRILRSLTPAWDRSGTDAALTPRQRVGTLRREPDSLLETAQGQHQVKEEERTHEVPHHEAHRRDRRRAARRRRPGRRGPGRADVRRGWSAAPRRQAHQHPAVGHPVDVVRRSAR